MTSEHVIDVLLPPHSHSRTHWKKKKKKSGRESEGKKGIGGDTGDSMLENICME